MFDTKTYVTRRNELKARLTSGMVLLSGNGESPINYPDNPYPFRQDSTFLYYFGIATPDLTAVIDIDENRTLLFGDEQSIDDVIWMGKQETLQAKAAASGVTGTRPTGALTGVITEALQKGRPIHFLPPYRPANRIRLSQVLGIPVERLSLAASVELIKAVVAQRSVKSPEEIAEIEKAVNVTVDMHLAVMRSAKTGMREQELAATVQYTAQRQGYALAYPTILTTRGQVLHNHYHGNTLREGQLVLNDSGAETPLGYAADLTRTFPAGRRFTPLQKDAYEVVLHALETATGTIAPRVRYLDIHFTACRALVDGLKDLGLMKGDIDAAVDAGAHTLFFQCGTGHMMGLDVHDMEDLGEQYVGYTDALRKDTQTFGLKSLRLARELQPGFVVTVEPGLYFIPELIDRWRAEKKLAAFINYDNVEKFRSFGGIRIEDDVLVTADGYRILGKPLAKSVTAIEALRDG